VRGQADEKGETEIWDNLLLEENKGKKEKNCGSAGGVPFAT
jgi:hypothetical protein